MSERVGSVAVRNQTSCAPEMELSLALRPPRAFFKDIGCCYGRRCSLFPSSFGLRASFARSVRSSSRRWNASAILLSPRKSAPFLPFVRSSRMNVRFLRAKTVASLTPSGELLFFKAARTDGSALRVEGMIELRVGLFKGAEVVAGSLYFRG